MFTRIVYFFIIGSGNAMTKWQYWLNDFWGGTAAMLVALPAAIAFGVTVYATIGAHYTAYGAMSGIMGVIILGIIAALLGTTNRLISAPSAPAAAVLTTFSIEFMNYGYTAADIFFMMTLVAFIAGLFQVLFGTIKLGMIIKYMPFPVVSGYLSGVGLYIISTQSPNFFGLESSTRFWDTMLHYQLWQWHSVLVGVVTIAALFFADRYFRLIPAVISALAVGSLFYFALTPIEPQLLQPDNRFVIGTLGGETNFDFVEYFSARLTHLSHLQIENIFGLLFPALTMAVLLSIDTLKTCVIVDTMSHSIHDSNKELITQGIGNMASSFFGGMPGSGTMGPTMMNITSGAMSRNSSMVEGVMGAIALIVLGGLIAWIPVSALAGVLIVIGLKMIDKHSINLLRSKKTVFDFLIIFTVAMTAISLSLIAAAGIGLILAAVLYIAQQIGMSIVYRHIDGTQTTSNIVRSPKEAELIEKGKELFSVYELHGSLFFGTANQLFTMLHDDLKNKKYIILDMKRVQNVDLTAAHILLRIKDILHEHNGYLLLCRLPHKLPTGDDMESYFNQVGLLRHLSPITIFGDLNDAVEWVEEKIMKEQQIEEKQEELLDLRNFELLKGRQEDTLEELLGLVQSRHYTKGEVIYRKGDLNGEIILIRRGLVRISLPFNETKQIHLTTLGQNNFCGEYSFLEGAPQYTDAIADADTDIYLISKKAFDQFSEHHKKASFHFMRGLSAVLAQRLRSTELELGSEVDV